MSLRQQRSRAAAMAPPAAWGSGSGGSACDGLARRAPLLVAGIVALLLINSCIQYSAGPAVQDALPRRGEQRRSSLRLGRAGDAGAGSTGASDILHDLTAGVSPGGADAELLCADHVTGCTQAACTRETARTSECKATCSSCEELRSAIRQDTGLQVRLVAHLSPCTDLHPSCGAWVRQDKCSREPRLMLELCQASCGFCLPPALIAGEGGSAVPDECQDDMSACPFVAFQGMCSSTAPWVSSQCARSCRRCTPGGSPASPGARVELTQQMLDSTGGADTAAATGAGPAGSNSGSSSSSSGDVLDELINGAPNASAVAAALLTHGALGTPSRSGLLVHGSHAQDGSSDDVEELLMWQLAGCHDAQPRCSAWATAGECTANVDYMAIACKASCGRCAAHSLQRPLRRVRLASGALMPTLGFGTAGLGTSTEAATRAAAAAGYRLFDTAASPDWYDAEAVGRGLAASGLPRAALFVVSKIHPRDFGRNATLAAGARAVAAAGGGYVDVLLLHYPGCSQGTNCVPTPTRRWQDSWRALEELVDQGVVHDIGVSNFGLGELRELLVMARVRPSVLQARSDPFAANSHLVAAALAANISFMGYSSLGTQWINSPAAVNPVFNNRVLRDIAARHSGKSVAQVVLRWALQRGQVVIPRSASAAHIVDNARLFDFSLSHDEVAAISALDGTWKTGGLPLPVA